MPKCVAVIPARGGSKSVHRKNMCVVAGKTLLRRAVETCLSATLVSEVYVSTEDEEIAAEAVNSGAKCIQRPTWLATDEASSVGVLLHACGFFDGDILVAVQCTAPLMKSCDVDGAIQTLIRHPRADCVYAVCPCHDWLCCSGDSGFLEAKNFCWLNPGRRQDMPKQWTIEGSVGVTWREPFMARKTFATQKTIGYPVPRRRIDIDEPDDVRWADILLTADQPMCYD